MNLYWKMKTFETLSNVEIHEMYLLRSEVFVVEQDCVYQDINEKDKSAIHLLAYESKKKKELVAYARLFKKGIFYKNYASIGRFVVRKKYRRKNIGEALMKKSITLIGDEQKIKINAQQYLEKFYAKYGFVTTGKPYLWDGIMHVDMIL